MLVTVLVEMQKAESIDADAKEVGADMMVFKSGKKGDQRH